MARISAAEAEYLRNEVPEYGAEDGLREKPRLKLYIDPHREERLRLRRRRRLLQRIMALLVVGILFSGSILTVTRMARINGQSKTIAELQASIDNLRSNQRSLTQRLEMQRSLDRVRDTATRDLGMQRRTEEQLRVISVSDEAAS